ncbi:hypothetical protein OHT76_44090 [Streptomyces sp. NBC_00287]|uniref:hypothetical protein n=1 Tax=Streptomyces sp. NBC_00287 TaxID=2975702 RepID=UPI002E2928F8|nr:hypothetical protein [Streptomyces sp. NBC_00287]
MTGHIWDADRIRFTVGVCEAGHLYVRNDSRGDSTHLLDTEPDADLVTLGQAIADVIGDLY